MAASPQLLSDAQMQQFVREGYLLVEADFPVPLHKDLCQRIEAVFEKEKNPGNNILPRLPQIQRVYDHPAVQGALASILGPDYLMNPHRHCHLNPPGSKGQNWHKDNYVFDEILRQPRPRWVFAFYYPQEVTPDMGPTGILPGRQYHHHISSDNPALTAETELPLCGPAGTVAIVHYDAWHRATPNQSERKRYMLKFLFERLSEPRAASWDHRGGAWPDAGELLDGVHAEVWNWLRGVPSPVAGRAVPAGLLEELRGGDQPERLKAAYKLAACGAQVLPVLVPALAEEAAAVAEHLWDKMPGNPRGSNPPACAAGLALAVLGEPAVPPLAGLLEHAHWGVRAMAADTLGNMGAVAQAAVPGLARLMADEHPRVRRHAAEALGRVGAGAAPALPALVSCVRDPDVRVRHNACLALAKIGHPAEAAIPPLLETLEDEDRYVRYFAGVALRRLATPESQRGLFDALFTSRWCPVTNPENMY
jgi:hypothetical protein